VANIRRVQLLVSQHGLVKDGNHLEGGSGGGSSKQIRMASKCGRIHPIECGLNQGQELLMKLYLIATGCHLPHGINISVNTARCSVTPTRQVGTRFSNPVGMEGWVVVGGWWLQTW